MSPAAVTPGWTTLLLTGFAELLAAAGVGVWNPAGVYTADQVGIVVGAMPAAPDALIMLSAYGTSADDTGMASTRLHVRTRWGGQDPRPQQDLADAIYGVLHDRTGYELPTGIRISQSMLVSAATLEQDGAKRWTGASNYEVDAARA